MIFDAVKLYLNSYDANIFQSQNLKHSNLSDILNTREVGLKLVKLGLNENVTTFTYVN